MATDDVEAGDQITFLPFEDKAVRLGFIRKVYGIVTTQLLVTFGFVLAPVLSEGVRNFVFENLVIFYVALGFYFSSFIALACCKIHRKVPINFICLGVFTLSLSILLSAVGAVSEPKAVLYAVVTTTVVTVALTAFAFQTKIDFTAFYGLALVALLCLVMMGSTMLIVQRNLENIAYSTLGAFIFSAFIVIDTQMIIGGYHKYKFSPEDYVFAAITLYVDVINLFLKLLALFSGRN